MSSYEITIIKQCFVKWVSPMVSFVFGWCSTLENNKMKPRTGIAGQAIRAYHCQTQKTNLATTRNQAKHLAVKHDSLTIYMFSLIPEEKEATVVTWPLDVLTCDTCSCVWACCRFYRHGQPKYNGLLCWAHIGVVRPSVTLMSRKNFELTSSFSRYTQVHSR